MSNDEAQMIPTIVVIENSIGRSFDILHSFDIGHSTFGIAVAFVLSAPTTRARPSMYSGGGMPNRSSTVGAMSSKRGLSAWMGWLQNKTPGTTDGSTQWSPLQAF